MNLKTDIDFDLKRFFHWWGRELSLCLPEKIRQLLSDKSGYVLLTVSAESIEFDQLMDDQKPQRLASLAINSSSSEKYQQLIAEHSELEKAEYVLRLTADQAINKIVYLPAVAKENLQQVVTFEMDRITPFKAEQVYFAAKILAKEQHGKIKVLLVLTPKEILDALYQQLKTAQIYPAFVDYSESANDFAEDLKPYNLLPEWAMPVKNKTTQTAIWGLSLIAIILAIAVFLFPVWQQGREVDELSKQLRQVEKESRLVQSQQLEIDALIEETERLIKVKNRAPALTGLINKLSELMPADTWLTHMKYNDDRIQIQGQSPAASVLISVLEASPLFSNARFVSPLTQDKRTGRERFQISMDVNSNGDTEDE